MNSRYREIEVAGSCQFMGRQLGEAAREEIRNFVAMAFERNAKTIAVSRETIRRLAAESAVFVESYAPEMLLELKGMSQGSGVPFEDLMFLQIRNQLTSGMDSGCTSISAGSSVTDTHKPLIGQNWDNDPALDPYTIVLTRRPTNKPAFVTITQAGLIAYIGFSDAGIAACLNTLPAPSRAAGVPHYFTLRRIFESRTLDDAVTAVSSAQRAIPANIMLATPEGPADLEVTVDDVHVLVPREAEILTHTNHCLHPELVGINEQFAEMIRSRPRLRRIDALMDVRHSLSLDALKIALRDHEGFPESLCRHANSDPQHGYWETVFSVIMSPESREMYVARGNPCRNDYEVYLLR